jgi:hypothetical protein
MKTCPKMGSESTLQPRDWVFCDLELMKELRIGGILLLYDMQTQCTNMSRSIAIYASSREICADKMYICLVSRASAQ